MNTRFIKSGNWHKTLTKGLKYAKAMSQQKGVKINQSKPEKSSPKKPKG